MPTIVFWNVGKTANAAMIADLAKETAADVLICAENHHDTTTLVTQLNLRSSQVYFPDPIPNPRLSTFVRLEPERDHVISDEAGISIRHFHFPGAPSLLMVGIHLPSKLWKRDGEQMLLAVRLNQAITEAEAKVGHKRTIVIGDLNMDPFEHGVVAAGGLHAVLDSKIAARESRTVSGQRHDFFYNPMWSLAGGLSTTTHGTYYYDSSSEVNYYWHAFDQILLRPALLPSLESDSVRVIKTIGGASLLDENGRPNKSSASDHLPIACRLGTIEVK